MANKDIPTEVNTDDTYTRAYKMRSLGEDGLNTVVSIPRVVIAKEARKRGMSIKEFLANFRAVAHFNGFEGVLYRFEPIAVDDKEQSPDEAPDEGNSNANNSNIQ